MRTVWAVQFRSVQSAGWKKEVQKGVRLTDPRHSFRCSVLDSQNSLLAFWVVLCGPPPDKSWCNLFRLNFVYTFLG